MNADFLISDHGTVWTIEAVSETAQEFAREHFAVEGWQGEPEHFSTDWRVADNLCQQLDADGFSIWVA